MKTLKERAEEVVKTMLYCETPGYITGRNNSSVEVPTMAKLIADQQERIEELEGGVREMKVSELIAKLQTCSPTSRVEISVAFDSGNDPLKRVFGSVADVRGDGIGFDEKGCAVVTLLVFDGEFNR